MFEQILAESGQFKCAKKKKPCLLMLTLDVKKAAVIIFEKKKYFSHNRNQDFTNFTTEGFKGYLMPGKFRQKQKVFFKQSIALYSTMKLLCAVINTHGVIFMIAT